MWSAGVACAVCGVRMTDIGLEEELLFGNLNIKIFKLNGLKQAIGCTLLVTVDV